MVLSTLLMEHWESEIDVVFRPNTPPGECSETTTCKLTSDALTRNISDFDVIVVKLPRRILPVAIELKDSTA